MPGPRRGDTSVTVMAAIHVDLVQSFSQATGAPIVTLSGGMKITAHLLPQHPHSKIRKLDLAC